MPKSLREANDGGSVHALKQVEALVAAGHSVEVFTRSETTGQMPPVTIECGARLWRVPYTADTNGSGFARDFSEGRSFVRGVLDSPAFAVGAFDAVHVHHWTSGVDLLPHLPQRLPLLFTPHLLPSEKARTNNLQLPARVGRLERELLTRADAVIALSIDEASACTTQGATAVELVPNGVSKDFLSLPRRRRPSSSGQIRIGTVGRICAQKATDVLLEGVELLLDAGVDVVLDIVGPPYYEEEFERNVRARATAQALAGRVVLHGSVPHSQMATLVGSWDIYIQPSRYESQGIALLEAMAAGRIVIATSIPAVTEYLSGNEGFLIAAPPTATDLKDALDAVLSVPSDEHWDSLSSNARTVARSFTWESTCRKLVVHVEKVVSTASWHGPRDDMDVRSRLREVADAHLTRLLESDGVVGVLLVGSGARGPAREGSDVDLVALTSTGRSLKQEYLFTDDVPIDVRFLPTPVLNNLATSRNADFINECVRSSIPDMLMSAVVLTSIAPGVERDVESVQRRRREPHIARAISVGYIRGAIARFSKARDRIVNDDSAPDGQLDLNLALQQLLVAALVDCGWIIQGAKRRIEIAADLAGQPQVREVASLLRQAMGTSFLTIEEALTLVEARTDLRAAHVSCLRRLGASADEVDLARRHAVGNVDYYTPAIHSGYALGCVNHIRALSGVPRIPSAYSRTFGYRGRTPAAIFLADTRVDRRVRQLWLKVVDPSCGDEIVEWSAEGLRLASAIWRSTEER